MILQILEENNAGLGFNEIYDVLKFDIGSRSTLSKLFKELIWEREIEKDELDGKYRIVDASLYKASSALTGAVSKYVKERSKKEVDPKKMLEALSKSIGGLSVHCALQEIKTNREWTKIASDYVSKDNYLLAVLRLYIINSGLKSKGIKPTIPIVRELMSAGVNLMNEDIVFEEELGELEFLADDLYPSRLREIINELSKLEYEPKEVPEVLMRPYKPQSNKK